MTTDKGYKVQTSKHKVYHFISTGYDLLNNEYILLFITEHLNGEDFVK